MLLLKYVHNGFLEDNKDSKIKSMFSATTYFYTYVCPKMCSSVPKVVTTAYSSALNIKSFNYLGTIVIEEP